MKQHHIAVFDFDGTLTHVDSMMAFLAWVAGPRRFAVNTAKMVPTLSSYFLGLLPRDAAKQRVLSCFLSGMPMETLKAKADHFAHRVIPKITRRKAMERLQWHQQKGHRCALLSASLETYLRPWARATGFDDVLGTQLEVTDQGVVTGQLAGLNCHGAEKVQRLQRLLGSREDYVIYAYGDSIGDKYLLDYADYGYYRSFPMEG